MSDMPKGTGSPEYDNAKPLIIQEYERLKKENQRLRERAEELTKLCSDRLCQRWDDNKEYRAEIDRLRDENRELITERDEAVNSACDNRKTFEQLQAENKRLRELLYKTTHTPFGKCNFDHLYEGNPCGECEACEHTKKVMKSVREALEGDDE